MNYYLGIDLGSTTTKAVIMDEGGAVVGRGITNSRSNYDVAAKITKNEALVNARFSFLKSEAGKLNDASAATNFLSALEKYFLLQQHLMQLAALRELSEKAIAESRCQSIRDRIKIILTEIFQEMEKRAPALYLNGQPRKSDFFRDLAGSQYMELAEQYAKTKTVSVDTLMALFDKCILLVENQVLDRGFEHNIRGAFAAWTEKHQNDGHRSQWRDLIEKAASTPFTEVNMVGTGYGRQRLPFPKECIRSEILCHGFGANAMFPGTATVLDIGGQDTKAIQVDASGVVTNFQMNDRCAAGCGRYLGYIADEMNLGLHELGPMSMQSSCAVKINSTCTVFAGAELRDRLAMGQKREDILAGLHRAIILRTMSLLARSGGVRNELTFTGGVARNPAAVKALRELVAENYGDLTINIAPDSIFTGALGAARFAREERRADV
jgi:benzoyl-CoA reductase subunit A